MNKRRDKLEIIHDILKVIRDNRGKIKPTHILYRSNLSYQMLAEYLDELINKELIIEIDTRKGKLYTLTKKGYEYLSKFNVITEIIDTFGLDSIQSKASNH